MDKEEEKQKLKEKEIKNEKKKGIVKEKRMGETGIGNPKVQKETP